MEKTNNHTLEKEHLLYITLTKENIENEHICCALSDKKCTEGYELKKQWLSKEFANGYIFRRLDARAKVFIEYVSAEQAWAPVTAPNYLMINCFWVSGQYKGAGHGYNLMQSVIEDAKRLQKSGIVTIAGTRKFHFMGDTKWFLKHGFELVDKLPNGFVLLALKFQEKDTNPFFNDCARTGNILSNEGMVVYYSNRCPYTEYYVNRMLRVLTQENDIPLKIIKFESREQAQSSPTPATIFSLFWNGKFITTDIGVCSESKFRNMLETLK